MNHLLNEEQFPAGFLPAWFEARRRHALEHKDINPDCEVTTHRKFYTPETSAEFDFSQYDYVVDAIDTVSGNIELVMQAQKSQTTIICSMGAGNKMDPTAFEVTDIYKTSVCPLARVMRYLSLIHILFHSERP